MDKEALLSIILSDISEVETLIKSFQGQANIPNAFIELTERKVNHLAEELHMLKGLGADTTESKPKEIVKPVETKQPEITEPIVEPTIVEEANVDIQVSNEAATTETTISEEQEDKATEEEIVVTNTIEKKIEAPVIEEKPIVENPTPNEIVAEKPAPTKVKIELEQDVVTETVETKTEQQNNLTLGETLQKGKKALNDQVTHADMSKKLLGKPVADLSKGLGINDRFLYQRELFNGNASLMTDTLGQLNEMDSFESAVSFLKSNFNWENEELSNDFFNYVQRRF